MESLVKIKLKRNILSSFSIIFCMAVILINIYRCYLKIENKPFLIIGVVFTVIFFMHPHRDCMYIRANYLYVSFWPYFVLKRIKLSNVIDCKKVHMNEASWHFEYTNNAYKLTYHRRFLKNRDFVFMTNEDDSRSIEQILMMHEK